MKNQRIIRALSLVFVSFLFSCQLFGDSPDKVFQTIGLNANKINGSFSRDFKELRQHKAGGSMQVPAADNKTLRPATCVEYVNYVYAQKLDRDVERIGKLTVTDETKPIINAALDLFRYADEVYKNDYPALARMIDEGKTDVEIDAAVEKLDSTKGAALDQKYKTTMDLLLPYADKHGVKYKVI